MLNKIKALLDQHVMFSIAIYSTIALLIFGVATPVSLGMITLLILNSALSKLESYFSTRKEVANQERLKALETEIKSISNALSFKNINR